jgi:hypothetical protein
MKMKQLLMTTIAIFGIATITMAQLPSYLPSNGLIGWWPFNGNANDESLNGNNGMVVGASLSTDRFGDVNKAYSFDGDMDYVKVLPLPILDNSFDFSLSTFILPSTSTGSRQFIVSRGYDYATGGFFLCHESVQNSDKLRFTVNGYGSLNLLTSNSYSIPYSNWQHFVAVKENNSIKLYINGLLTDSSIYSNQLLSNSDTLYFGVHRFQNQAPGWFPYYFNGKIDDIGIWNRALNQEEITSLYTGSALGVNEVSQSNLFSVFPNPAQNVINVNLDAKLLGSVFTIYDNIGKAVKTGKLNSLNTTIDLIDLSSGIYTFNLGENRKQNFKVIKE